MATYLELRGLFNNADLRNRVGSAALISVNAILEGTPTTKDKAYAVKLISDTHSEAEKILKFVLAANHTLTTAQITGSTDPALQTKVDAIVLILIDALAGV